MAQLPPKIPNMAHSWCSSPHQRLPFMTNTNSISTNLSSMTLNNANANANTNQTQSSWVDEFLDFSSVRRGTHRRSVSDSVAFLDPQATPFGEECRGNSTMHVPSADANCGGFDRFDDEQLMSMFSDDLSVPATSNPSTPSDQNSNNEEKTTASPSDHHHLPKNEPGEADSSGQNELQATHQQQHPAASDGDAIVDPKRVKSRILANRQSAQRSRVRKLQYVSELERSVTSLQTEVSALSPRVAFFDHQRLILNVDNSALKQRIAALAQDNIFKDAHQEALKKEIERLRQLFHHQNTKNTNNNINAAPPPPPSQSQQPSMNKSANSQT